jgi:hypothetical protein
MYDKEYTKPLGEIRDRCAVSDFCEGVCREKHLQQGDSRCPVWYSDEMDRRKRRKR